MDAKKLSALLWNLAQDLKQWYDREGSRMSRGRDADLLTFRLATKDSFERAYVALLLDRNPTAGEILTLYDKIQAALSVEDCWHWDNSRSPFSNIERLQQVQKQHRDNVYSSYSDLVRRCQLIAQVLAATETPADGDPSDLEHVKMSLCPHSPDFRSVNWFGQEYSFTASQAACIRTWWRYWRTPSRDVGDATVLETAGCASNRVSEVFKRNSAWGEMIVEGDTRGTHRLREPNEPKKPAPKQKRTRSNRPRKK